MAIAKYKRTCGKNLPGNRYQICLADIANITEVEETSNEISDITMSGVTTFHEVQAEIDSVQFTQDGTFGTSGASTQNLIFKLGLPSTEASIFLDSLKASIACGIAAIVVDNNSKAWLVGATIEAKEGTSRPFNSMQIALDSGTLLTDADTQAYTVTLTRLSGYERTELDATITSEIIARTSDLVTWN
jgi:hypothetical protein